MRARAAAWCGSRAAIRCCLAAQRRDGRADEAGVPYEIVPGVSAAFAAAAAHWLLADRSRVGFACDFFHRASCAVAQSRGAAGAGRRDARGLHAGARPDAAGRRVDGRRACRRICPARWFRARRSPISRWRTPRWANWASWSRRRLRACCGGMGGAGPHQGRTRGGNARDTVRRSKFVEHVSKISFVTRARL